MNVVKAIVEKQQLNHPVLWDMNCRNHENYGLKNWPVAYLVDTHGKVFWEGNPARVVNRPQAAAELHKLIEEKLKAVKATGEAAAVRRTPDRTVAQIERTSFLPMSVVVIVAALLIFGFIWKLRSKDQVKTD